MVLNIYAMFDRLDGCHKALVTGRSDARAVRTFLEEMKKSPLDINEHELHKLGTYDDVTGVLTPIVPYEVMPLNVKETQEGVD